MTQAALTGLLAVTLASAIWVIQGLRTSILRYKAATLLAIFGDIFTPYGIWLAHRISNQFISLIFATVLTYVAWRIWQQIEEAPKIDNNQPAPSCEVNPVTSKLFWTELCTKRLIFIGSVAEFISGLLGVGGGFIIVLTLHKVSNLGIKSTAETSLAVIAFVSTTTLITYISQHAIDLHIAIPFS